MKKYNDEKAWNARLNELWPEAKSSSMGNGIVQYKMPNGNVIGFWDTEHQTGELKESMNILQKFLTTEADELFEAGVSAELAKMLDDKADGADEVTLNGKTYFREGPKDSTSQPGPWQLCEARDVKIKADKPVAKDEPKKDMKAEKPEAKPAPVEKKAPVEKDSGKSTRIRHALNTVWVDMSTNKKLEKAVWNATINAMAKRFTAEDLESFEATIAGLAQG